MWGENNRIFQSKLLGGTDIFIFFVEFIIVLWLRYDLVRSKTAVWNTDLKVIYSGVVNLSIDL